MNNFEFFGPNLSKNGFWGLNFKNLSPDLEFALPRYHVYQFSTDNFDFFSPNLPKLGFQIQETNVGIRISILEILYVPIFRQNGQLWDFGTKFTQKWILGSKFQKSNSGFGISILDILCSNFQRKRTYLNFWAQICPKMDFGFGISKILSLDSESTPPKYLAGQVSVKMGNFWFFGLNLGKLLNYV